MKKSILIILYVFSSVHLFCQQHDKYWLLGYRGGLGTPPAQRFMISFNPTLTIDSISTRMNFITSNGAIADKWGRLLFFTNGNYIADATGDTMFNGKDLNQSPCSVSYSPFGIPVPQSEIILPSPSDTNVYYIFHTTCDLITSPLGEPRKLMYSTVDMTLNGGLGGVVQKNIPIFFDMLAYGQMTSCRHGNGRDWWIFVPQYQTNIYHRVLLTSGGIIEDTVQYGSPHPGQSHPGSAVFSPDGQWYCRYDPNTGISLMKFDRCDGTFSNELTKDESYFPNSNSLSGGLEFSPSSGFLYVTSIMEVNQFDMNALDIMNSQIRVAQIDTFVCTFGVNLLWPTLAPDGKIYINSTNGNNCISYIDQPDSPGVACNVIKHGITFPFSISGGSTFPNNPNFRLGMKDCTTGLNDIKEDQFSVYPNPSRNKINFQFKGEEKEEFIFTLYSSLGILIKSVSSHVSSTKNELDISTLAKGIYLYSFTLKNGSTNRGYFIHE
ncbi:MAG: T9SS type A sorting domain-containing protein [Bacteroidia bacterium]|nr:T9SS type A sorting domain-containing protein [Bacteroidia bacterium]